MTPGDDVSRETSTPWQRYQDRERTARDLYLTRVSRAHHVYLVGPYPDRDAYIVVERDAWVTYYAACRDAWHTCATALDTTAPPPPPPPESHPYRPLRIPDSIVGNPWPTMRDVSPYPPADHSVSGAGVPYPAPSFNPHSPPSVCGFSPYSDAELGRFGRRCTLPYGHVIDHNDKPPGSDMLPTESAVLRYVDAHQEQPQAPDHRPESER